MSENPYAPPSADLASRDSLRGLDGTGDFEIGICISEAWANTWANFPLWLGVGVVLIVLMALSAVTLIGLLLALPHLVFGATFFFLRMHDGEAEFRDIFAGFSDYGRVLVNVLVMVVIVMLLSILAQSIYYLGIATDSGVLMSGGYLISLAFNLFISSRLTFAYFYLVDFEMTGVESLRTAWERTAIPKWKCAGLIVVTLLVTIVGMLALLVGVIPASVMSYLMWASAYRQIEGRAAAV